MRTRLAALWDGLECPDPGAGPRRYQGDIMKKQMKKLRLAKETMGSLDLGRVTGGETDLACPVYTLGCPTGDCTATSPSARVICKK